MEDTYTINITIENLTKKEYDEIMDGINKIIPKREVKIKTKTPIKVN